MYLLLGYCYAEMRVYNIEVRNGTVYRKGIGEGMGNDMMGTLEMHALVGSKCAILYSYKTIPGYISLFLPSLRHTKYRRNWALDSSRFPGMGIIAIFFSSWRGGDFCGGYCL